MTTRQFTPAGLMSAVICALVLLNAPVARAQVAAQDSVMLDPFDPVPEIQFRHFGAAGCWDDCEYRDCWRDCSGRGHCYRGCRHISREHRFDRDAARVERDDRHFRVDEDRFNRDASEFERAASEWHARYGIDGRWDQDPGWNEDPRWDRDNPWGRDGRDGDWQQGATHRHDEHVQERREEHRENRAAARAIEDDDYYDDDDYGYDRGHR